MSKDRLSLKKWHKQLQDIAVAAGYPTFIHADTFYYKRPYRKGLTPQQAWDLIINNITKG